MAERLINSKCQDEQQIAAEIAGLPSHIKRLIDVGVSKASGYPIVAFRMSCRCEDGLLENYVAIDAQLLAQVDDVKEFIRSELIAHVDGIVIELVEKRHLNG